MSAIDDLTTVPAQPEISEGNKTFSQKTYALYVWIRTRLLPAMIELRDLIVNSVTGAFSGTSTTSVTIVDTGEVSITTDTGRSFKPGTPVRLANVADPRIYIDGITKTYNASTGALAFYAQAKAGSGTYTSWSLTIIPSGGGLAGLGSNTFVGAQFVPDDAYDAVSWAGSSAVPTKKAIRDKIESMLIGKTGSIFPWPFPTAPAGAMALPLLATNLSRATYSSLHAVVQSYGYPWGAGDGSTTFGIPYVQADGTWLQANGNVASTTTGVVKEHTHNVNTGNTGVGNYPVCGPSSGNVSTVANQLAGGTANIAAGSRGLWCIWL